MSKAIVKTVTWRVLATLITFTALGILRQKD